MIDGEPVEFIRAQSGIESRLIEEPPRWRTHGKYSIDFGNRQCSPLRLRGRMEPSQMLRRIRDKIATLDTPDTKCPGRLSTYAALVLGLLA